MFLLFYTSTDVPVCHYTVLHVHRCTYSSLYLFSLFLLFQHNMHNDLSTHLWVPTRRSTRKYNLPVYTDASPLPKNKELPVTTTTFVPAHRCTRSWPYLFICILSFRSTVKNYPSTFPLFYMSTDVPFHQYTCSVLFSFFFGITCAMTFQLIYTQIHQKLNLPVYLYASLPSNHKDLPVTTTSCVHARRCSRSWPYLFIFRFSFRLTIKIYPFTVLLFYMSTDEPVQQYTCSACFSFLA